MQRSRKRYLTQTLRTFSILPVALLLSIATGQRNPSLILFSIATGLCIALQMLSSLSETEASDVLCRREYLDVMRTQLHSERKTFSGAALTQFIMRNTHMFHTSGEQHQRKLSRIGCDCCAFCPCSGIHLSVKWT